MADPTITLALQMLAHQVNAINGLTYYINQKFVKVVELLHDSTGRVIITGIGKSAIIAQKIVATFNSTGTPAAFMHAADALHGDLGMIQPQDQVICISKSGDTPEIQELVSCLKRDFKDNKLIAMVGNINSFLAQQADLVLNTFVASEACPLNLAPTASTIAQLVMGDALAICLLDKRNFKKVDFSKYHPGGALGKQLLLKISDLLVRSDRKDVKPQVSLQTSIADVIYEISSKRLGCTAVIAEKGNKILGIITDGDLRRMMEKGLTDFSQLKVKDILNLKVKEIMHKKPFTINEKQMAVEALRLLENHKISQLLVMDDAGLYKGVVHVHDLISEGI